LSAGVADLLYHSSGLRSSAALFAARSKNVDHCKLLRMSTTRLEAFSDGVFAIIITIMVLELKVPHGTDLAALRPLLPIFLSYVLSFIFLGIYWNNHHHMLQAVNQIRGVNLWANLHLLFWLSLIPFTTGWMGENNFAAVPVAVYGLVLLLSAIAYWLLQRSLIITEGPDSELARAVGSRLKEYISVAVCAAAVAIAPWVPLVACGCYFLIALMWLVPDPRIERRTLSHEK
jgi:TMEM175 potassium channel family protein